jgi:cytochrome P450
MDKTIIHALLESDLSSEDKVHSRIWQEAQVVIGAGADTAANSLNVTHFHLLENPDALRKLQAELREAMPDKYEPAKLSIVEHLPYLVCTSTFYAKSYADCIFRMPVYRKD